MFRLLDTVIITPIVNILFVIYNFIGDFGIAIILFAVMVKFLTWPLLKKQLTNAKLMRKLQPELAEIKKRCKGNRQLETLQMLELYKRYNVRPFRSLLTTLIQIPIFFALFTAINVVAAPRQSDNIEKRAYSFISENLPNIKSTIEKQRAFLADPGSGYDFHPKLFGILNLDTRPGVKDIHALTLLTFCFIAAYLQYLIMKASSPAKNKRTFRQILRDASQGKEPDQSEINGIAMQQMAFMMPVMMFLFMANLPGAIVFYYSFSNAIYLVQQKLIFDRNQSDMEISADKAVIKELAKIKEAQIVEPDTNKKLKITRISAGNSKRRK